MARCEIAASNDDGLDQMPGMKSPSHNPHRSVVGHYAASRHRVAHSAVAAALTLLLATGTAPAQAAPAGFLRPPALAPGALVQVPSGTAATPSAEDEAAGRRHYKRGDELFKQGKFLEAAHEFEAGFAVAPRPLFLLNIGHSYRRAQELRRARVAYEEYLKADPTSSYRADVEDLIKTIDDALGTPTVPPAPITPTPSSPPPTAPVLPPAAPVPSVRTGTINLAPPVLVEVEKPSDGQSSDAGSIFRSPWFWGAVGVVVAAGVAGTVYGLNRPPACNATRCLRETD